VKLNSAQTIKALEQPPAHVRLFVLYGPDESEARSLAQRLERAMGADAERVDLDTATLKADPARLSDEAASFSMFGGKRHIRVQPAGDDILPAVEALLTASTAGNPVVILPGNVKDTNALIKRVINDPAVVACQCYPPKAGDIEAHAAGLAHDMGMRLSNDLAPDHPREADQAALDAIGAGEGEAELSRLVNAVLEGNALLAATEAERLEQDGIEGIGLIRSFKTRLQLLLKLAPQMQGGKRAHDLVEAQGKAIFWMEKPHVTRQLERWPPDRLATAANRLLAAERAVKSAASAGPILVAAELIQIARVAARPR
jgi:DNA polymerase-3 subunit delta